jgi:hypothetical protein
MSIQINPQTAYNGMISGQRNMFLSSSIAFVILGFSDSFKHRRTHFIIQLFGLGLLFLSIYIGLKANYNLELIINNMDKKNINKTLENILNEFLSWKWVVYIYAIMLILLIIMYTIRKINVNNLKYK